MYKIVDFLISSITLFVFGVIIPFTLIFSFCYYTLVFIFNLNVAFILYLTLTATSIVTSNYIAKIIRFFLDRIYRHHSDKINEDYNKMMTLFTNNKVRFIVYSLYFIYLIIYSFIILNQFDIYINNAMSIGVLYSFATFIAFERIIQNKNLLSNE